MSPEWILVTIWLGLTCIAGFVLMGVDKARAQDGSWRIPERVFVRLALIGGAFGVILGSSAFHHKSRKNSFIEVVFIIAIGWAAVLVGLERMLGPPFT